MTHQLKPIEIPCFRMTAQDYYYRCAWPQWLFRAGETGQFLEKAESWHTIQDLNGLDIPVRVGNWIVELPGGRLIVLSHKEFEALNND